MHMSRETIQSSRRREDVSFPLHSEIAGESTAAAQDKWLARVADENMSLAQLRTARRLAKRQAHAASGELPAGKFRVVYADPPWAYDDSGVLVPVKTKPGHAGDNWGRADRHYPTMSIEELCAVAVKDHVTEDAVLFLWVTSPLLNECWPVIEASVTRNVTVTTSLDVSWRHFASGRKSRSGQRIRGFPSVFDDSGAVQTGMAFTRSRVRLPSGPPLLLPDSGSLIPGPWL